MGNPWPLSFILGLFQANINTFLQQIHSGYGAGIRTHNLQIPLPLHQDHRSTKQEVFEKTVKIKAHTGEGKIDLFKIMLQAAACSLKCLMEIDDGTIGRNTEVVNF